MKNKNARKLAQVGWPNFLAIIQYQKGKRASTDTRKLSSPIQTDLLASDFHRISRWLAGFYRQ
jgi:hypothetical protein